MERLFVAIKIIPAENLQSALDTIRRMLSEGKINWVDTSKMHITLKFLGDTPATEIPAIVQALKQSAQITAPFVFGIKNFGFFGSPRFPKVLWLGIEEPRNNIETLYQSVQQQMKTLDFPEGDLSFRPHLTIGRVKSPVQSKILFELKKEYSGLLLQEVTVNSFVLYKSQLTPTGPLYTEIETFNLKNIQHDQ